MYLFWKIYSFDAFERLTVFPSLWFSTIKASCHPIFDLLNLHYSHGWKSILQICMFIVYGCHPSTHVRFIHRCRVKNCQNAVKIYHSTDRISIRSCKFISSLNSAWYAIEKDFKANFKENYMKCWKFQLIAMIQIMKQCLEILQIQINFTQ